MAAPAAAAPAAAAPAAAAPTVSLLDVAEIEVTSVQLMYQAVNPSFQPAIIITLAQEVDRAYTVISSWDPQWLAGRFMTGAAKDYDQLKFMATLLATRAEAVLKDPFEHGQNFNVEQYEADIDEFLRDYNLLNDLVNNMNQPVKRLKQWPSDPRDDKGDKHDKKHDKNDEDDKQDVDSQIVQFAMHRE